MAAIRVIASRAESARRSQFICGSLPYTPVFGVHDCGYWSWQETTLNACEAALAALCGASPLPASSGKTQRHRLNRGGSREANNALWTIAMVRMRSDARTRAYVARRSAEGLSTKEIQRCLKRYVVRELYPLILADLRDAVTTC